MVVWTEESRGGSGGPFNLLVGRSTNERLLSLSVQNGILIESLRKGGKGKKGKTRRKVQVMVLI